MSNRYDTLDVTLNLNNSNIMNPTPKKFANTIDFGEKSQLYAPGQNDERVNKFRQLYFKNQKLRKELKLLNVKLNQKLQKVKLFPSKNKKAMSVDLNVQKPTKALQRQLQNAYKQVAMYKKQIASLKVKQQSQSTYQKYKVLQNQISYKDIEITKIQAELKSIKNIKKMQDKTLIQEVENDDMKQKLQQYERQFKQGQQKLKEIAKKARKRQQEYKKQQAYQVALEKKLRNLNSNLDQQEEDEIVMTTNNNKLSVAQAQVNEKEVQQVKEEIQKYKSQNELNQKKIEIQKKTVRDFKKNRTQCEQKYKQFDIEIKGLMLKIQSYRRLIKDHQKKTSEFATAYNTVNKSQKLGSLAQKESSLGILKQIYLESSDPEDLTIRQELNRKYEPFQISQAPSVIKDQRQWKGKPKKVTFGYMDSNDSLHKISGVFRGIKVWKDESQLICGMAFFYKQNGVDLQSGVIGNRTNNEQLFQIHPTDKIAYIQGSLTEQGYLAHLVFVSRLNVSARFGIQGGVDNFSCKIEANEDVTGFYCAARKLGKDSRISELGFWISKKE